MEKTEKILLTVLLLPLLLEGVFAAFGQWWSPDGGVLLTPNADLSLCYTLESVSDVVALCFYYLSVRMSTFGFTRSMRKTDAGYLRFAIIRLALLHCVVNLGLITHYVFACPSTLWLSAVALPFFLFVWPTRERRLREMVSQDEDAQN